MCLCACMYACVCVREKLQYFNIIHNVGGLLCPNILFLFSQSLFLFSWENNGPFPSDMTKLWYWWIADDVCRHRPGGSAPPAATSLPQASAAAAATDPFAAVPAAAPTTWTRTWETASGAHQGKAALLIFYKFSFCCFYVFIFLDFLLSVLIVFQQLFWRNSYKWCQMQHIRTKDVFVTALVIYAKY